MRVHDAQDQPVRKATVALTAAMDQSKSMDMDMDKEKPQTVGLLEGGDTAGSYSGNMNLRYKGPWIFTVKVTAGDVSGMADFAVDVSGGGTNWIVIAVFGGAAVAVIAGAAVLRSRRRKAAPAGGVLS